MPSSFVKCLRPFSGTPQGGAERRRNSVKHEPNRLNKRIAVPPMQVRLALNTKELILAYDGNGPVQYTLNWLA